MISGRIEGATRELAKDQPEYNRLWIRDVRFEDGSNLMISAWLPTPDELVRMVKGAPVYLSIVGGVHPPVSLRVGKPPE